MSGEGGGDILTIRSVEYAGTVATPDGPLPGSLPQVAFSGRSNVGKSSLINTLLRRTRNRIAHVSATPGKTQAINFFSVNDVFYLVDLPGYGYAKVPKTMRNAWRGLIEGYLRREEGLRGIVQLIDSRRGATESDLEMIEFLADIGLPTLIVLTKVDKLKPRERAKAVKDAVAALGVDAEQLLPFSSKTGEGRDELLASITELLEMDE